jgi:hypothetical protein
MVVSGSPWDTEKVHTGLFYRPVIARAVARGNPLMCGEEIASFALAMTEKGANDGKGTCSDGENRRATAKRSLYAKGMRRL